MKTLLNWIVTLVLDIFTEVVVIEVGDEDTDEDSYTHGIRILLGYRMKGEVTEPPASQPVDLPVTWEEFTKYNRMVSNCLNKMQRKGAL